VTLGDADFRKFPMKMIIESLQKQRHYLSPASLPEWGGEGTSSAKLYFAVSNYESIVPYRTKPDIYLHMFRSPVLAMSFSFFEWQNSYPTFTSASRPYKRLIDQVTSYCELAPHPVGESVPG
jgi:hypothetical protein